MQTIEELFHHRECERVLHCEIIQLTVIHNSLNLPLFFLTSTTFEMYGDF